MSISSVEYVPSTDTIADIALAQTQSTSLRTSSAILLSVLFISSFVLNLVVIAAILAGKKLRAALFRRLLVLLSSLHIVFLFTVLLPSLIFVANGTWTLGDFLCRGNAFCQQFCALFGTLILLTMATERATTITQKPFPLFGGMKTIAIISTTIVIALCLTVPILFPVIPVQAFTNRYLCSIGVMAPIYRPATQIFLYLIILSGMLICTGAIYTRRQISSIPQQSHEFTLFITKTRALQEDTLLGKMTIRLFCAYVLIVGPYIVLELILEICDSKELQSGVTIQQDLDTLLTWLSFIYPLVAPIMIFCSCDDIWSQVLETFCCKSQEPPTIGSYLMGNTGKNNPNSGVMTLVATSEGVQLRLPSNIAYPHLPMAPAYEEYITYPTRPAAPRPDIEANENEDEVEAPILPIKRNEQNRRSRIPEPQAGPSTRQTQHRRAVNSGGIKKPKVTRRNPSQSKVTTTSRTNVGKTKPRK
ncbi:unnamed protein product, partial [Mesorhabditis belari]|uniref:G-protein coupled receptors family 1 profile domain-containing protein n=1 Tax=Mesorhabditis belari TaxID=2138241 RepID=A0AAF3EHV2_9BILA